MRSHLQTPQNEVKWGDFQRPHAEKQKKKDDSDVVTDINHGVASSFPSSSKSEMGITEIEGAQKNIASFQRWTPWTDTDKPDNTYLPQSQACRFPHGWLMISSSHGDFHYDQVDHRW